MSHAAWRVKLSSTLVYGATSRWKREDSTTREKAGRRERDILMACHLSICGVELMNIRWLCRSRAGESLVGWLLFAGWLGFTPSVAQRTVRTIPFLASSNTAAKNAVFMTPLIISPISYPFSRTYMPFPIYFRI